MTEIIKMQHYVPRVYLRNFSFDQKSNDYAIYCFDKTNSKAFPVNISNIACERFFYDIENDEDQTIEKLLCKYEGAYAGVYNKIIENWNLNCLNSDERTILAFFFSIQYLRTKEQRISYRDVFNCVKDRLTQQCSSESLKEDLEACGQESVLKEGHLTVFMKAVPEMAQKLLTMKWTLCKNTTTMPFWASDNPIVMDNHAENKYDRYLGYACPGIEMYLPLNPQYCLAIFDSAKYHVLPGIMETKSIENVIYNNCLQLMNSTRFIFSNTEDFSYAEKFLEKKPEYKSVDRQRIFPP
ncbi:MAG: DUF4238 domain-containing protein [Methanoregula sp.]